MSRATNHRLDEHSAEEIIRRIHRELAAPPYDACDEAIKEVVVPWSHGDQAPLSWSYKALGFVGKNTMGRAAVHVNETWDCNITSSSLILGSYVISLSFIFFVPFKDLFSSFHRFSFVLFNDYFVRVVCLSARAVANQPHITE